MRAVDLSLAGAVVDQERIGIVLHDLDGGAVAEAEDSGAVCERDRDGTRDLRSGSGVAVLFWGQRARTYAGAVGHAGGGVAESERVGPEESGDDVKVAAAAHPPPGTVGAVSGEVATLSIADWSEPDWQTGSRMAPQGRTEHYARTTWN